MLSLTTLFDQIQQKDELVIQGETYKLANIIMAVEEDRVLKGQVLLIPNSAPNACVYLEFSSKIYRK